MGQKDVIIIGAGLAGLTAAIELARSGLEIMVFDKHPLPRHKVCGEYLSMEVVPYLDGLGVTLEDAPVIKHFVLSSSHGRTVRTELPLGGIGISRYALDYRLLESARKAGVQFIWEAVESVRSEGELFEVCSRSKHLTASHVLGCWGKRSHLDRVFGRTFFKGPSPWMGVKIHYKAQYPSSQVGLCTFRGGYGGLSVTETGAVNFCYLIHREVFRDQPELISCTHRLIGENPALREVLNKAEPLFDTPLSISNVSFEKKEIVSNHILLAGDAARLIHPLCGNGMAMAIRAGQLQATTLNKFASGQYADRIEMEKDYRKNWNRKFRNRVWTGIQLQQLMIRPGGIDTGIRLAALAPGLLRLAIRKTHGSA